MVPPSSNDYKHSYVRCNMKICSWYAYLFGKTVAFPFVQSSLRKMSPKKYVSMLITSTINHSPLTINHKLLKFEPSFFLVVLIKFNPKYYKICFTPYQTTPIFQKHPKKPKTLTILKGGGSKGGKSMLTG